MVSSGVIYTTFLVHTICAIPELYYSWFTGNALHLMVSVVWFVGVLAETVLLSFADKREWRDSEEQAKSLDHSPELHCSFLNRLILWWFNPLPRLGARRSLEIDDLFQLNHRSTSDYLVPLWERYWTPTIKGRGCSTINLSD